MGTGNLKRRNHYVPRAYLKRWADSKGKVATYRVLVSHPDVPLWKSASVKGVAYHEHLYTQVIGGDETDDFECWLDSEFERPAEESIRKVIANNRLSPEDWRNLIFFLAAQDVRTPARMMECLHRWHESQEGLLQETLNEAIHEWKEKAEKGEQIDYPTRNPIEELFPGRISIESNPETGEGLVKAETSVGRSMWLFAMRHVLTTTAKHLLKHKWTILRAPSGVNWLTSDNPVVRLSFSSPHRYDFKGGWGSKGTEVHLPLTPSHMMYTKIGERPPQKNSIIGREWASWIQRITAEHAYRYIFGVERVAQVRAWRPRLVDGQAFNAEIEQWRRWNRDQSTAEREIFG